MVGTVSVVQCDVETHCTNRGPLHLTYSFCSKPASKARACFRTRGCGSCMLRAMRHRCESTSSVYCMHISESARSALLRTHGSRLVASCLTSSGVMLRPRGSERSPSFPSAAQAWPCSTPGSRGDAADPVLPPLRSDCFFS